MGGRSSKRLGPVEPALKALEFWSSRYFSQSMLLSVAPLLCSTMSAWVATAPYWITRSASEV